MLPNGLALVVGGSDGPGAGLASTELYDPVTGAFSAGQSMIHARSSHTATALADGRILIVGGQDRAISTVHASAELYQP